ncbi:iron-containing alcohol dehydrogenase [Cohnella pontilimi]|uniref:Iron-containing alcohol dehydrogenase n=1 Tax=Cohnella pontilimi TaxID=2564100 RepID=A0A4U0FI14_9BACL|nr:iron-containing alcohol dehydrogenase [Cohnella pontilimi]TJY43082.1 iron-containing alcohol dehydrogenase [Cohnella pontilimi]
MKPFIYENPTRLYFGEGQIRHLITETKRLGNKVLLLYGGGSIKRNGVYDAVMNALKEAGAEVLELSGVDPNPRISTVRRGAQMCNEHNIDWVLAVGGGSVIDCAKAIAAAAVFDGDFWDVVSHKRSAQGALPIGTVLTLAATGSEMNAGSVITNEETQEKMGWSASPHTFPKFSILDPAYTVSVPKEHTVYGIVDMMSHVFEQYFHHDEMAPVQDGFCESILRAIVQTAPKLVEDLENVELRGIIMYCGTMALNGLLSMGVTGDWANHDMEHAVSAVYDIPHGGGLAILFPHWMDVAVEKHPERFAQLAENVFGIKPEGRSALEVGKEGIQALRDFWRSIGAPTRLSDYNIDDSRLILMAGKATTFGPRGRFITLTLEDIADIYTRAL